MNSSAIKIFLITALIVAILSACASIGNPSGGSRDEDPPRLVKASPAQGATNVQASRIILDFDEIVNLKDAFTNVVMTPAAKSAPRASASGRRVTIDLPDSLLPNTTYTIDFGKAIEDNNEGNRLPGFFYTFSTGPVLDSLRVSGIVLSADNLEPQQGITVGLHTDLSDSAFVSTRLVHIARTDDRGRFIIRGLPDRPYRIFALNDKDADLRYANPEEELAFRHDTIHPYSRPGTAIDTIFNLLTGAVDTVISRERTIFLPNDLLLRSFNSGIKRQFLAKYERPDSARIQIIYNAPSPTPNHFSIVGEDNAGIVVERNVSNDSLTYWLPPRIASRDTLRVALAYMRPDSTGMEVMTPDSVTLIYKRPKPQKQKNKDKKKEEHNSDSIPALPEVPDLSWQNLSSSSQEVYLPLTLEFKSPLERLDSTAFRLEQKVDTLWVPASKELRILPPDSLRPRRVAFDYPWEHDMAYRLSADSAAVVSIYGEVMRPLSIETKTRPLEDYATLSVSVTGIPDSIPAFVQLVNQSDAPLRTAPLIANTASFRYLNPGKYYMRITLDYDGDGKWSPGNYEENRDPDETFYYPKVLNIKKNWDYNQSWDLWAVPVDLQKPDAIKKNKPEAPKNSRKKTGQESEEEEDQEMTDMFGNPLNGF